MLYLLKDVAQAGLPLLSLAAVVVLWRQLLHVQEKYEALVKEVTGTLAVIAKELEHEK